MKVTFHDLGPQQRSCNIPDRVKTSPHPTTKTHPSTLAATMSTSEANVLRQAMHHFSYAETFWRYSYMEAAKVIADKDAEIRALKARVHQLETMREDVSDAGSDVELDSELDVELDGVLDNVLGDVLDNMLGGPLGGPLNEQDDSPNASDASYASLIDSITFRHECESP